MDKKNYGWTIFWILTILGVLLLAWRFEVGCAIIAIAMLYFTIAFVEIKAPKFGLLYSKGELVEVLSAGWHLRVPGLYEIDTHSSEWKSLTVEETMYTKVGLEIEVEAQVSYAPNPAKPGRLILLLADKEQVEKRITAAALAVLRGVVGQYSFDELNANKNTLEPELLKSLRLEMSKYGYRVKDFDIVDFNEVVESRAKEIERLGEARAKVASDMAHAIPKDNVAGAIVAGIGTLAPVLGELFQGKGTPKPADKPATPPSVPPAGHHHH